MMSISSTLRLQPSLRRCTLRSSPPRRSSTRRCVPTCIAHTVSSLACPTPTILPVALTSFHCVGFLRHFVNHKLQLSNSSSVSRVIARSQCSLILANLSHCWSRFCERGVIGQRARLQIGRSAQGILLRGHPHGRGKGRSQGSRRRRSGR